MREQRKLTDHCGISHATARQIASWITTNIQRCHDQRGSSISTGKLLDDIPDRLLFGNLRTGEISQNRRIL